MAPVVEFDDGKGALGPLTDLRAAFDVRTGALTTLERLRLVLPGELVALYTPEGIAGLAAEDHDLPINRMPVRAGHVLVVNGRCPIPPAELREPERDVAYLDPIEGTVVGGLLEVGETPECAIQTLDGPVLMSRPWHVRSVRDQAIRFDLDLIRKADRQGPMPSGVLVIGDAEDVLVDADATVYPGVTIDVEQGPVWVAGHAVLRPGAVVVGPAAIGPHSTVLEHAVVRGNTSIGRRCKVGGEVSGVIFQGFANKAHEGFLGDSWIGQWSNLGAGTTNSNLLNTYSEVIAQATPGGPRERTGETFLGAIIGDHVRTAIGTRIMTGAVVHTGAMWAASGAISGCVGRFAWVTDEGARSYRLGKFVDVARTVMSRRDVEPSDAYLARLSALHAAAAQGS
jgi:UDP-N-acetylglucosamine diphosphorylase/glucosamine-1-phosphate N-acetyltransferase